MRKRLPWRGDRWNPVIGRFFERRLQRRSDTLARIVGLDDPTEIAGIVRELATEVRRTWAICLDVNRASSDATVRHSLADLLKRPDEIGERVWSIDPNTRGLIEDFAPDSHPFLEHLQDHPDLLTSAVQEALSSLPAPDRGRPRGVVNHAERHLALQLAQLYQKASCREPTRRYRNDEELEYGPFKDFVEKVLEVFPRRARGLRGHEDIPVARSTDTFTKLAIELYREARNRCADAE